MSRSSSSSSFLSGSGSLGTGSGRQQRPGRMSGFAATSALSTPVIAAGALAATAVVGLIINGRRLSHKPLVYAQHTRFFDDVLSRCPTVHQEYHVVPMLANCHVETIVAAKMRRDPGLQYLRELLSMQDGGTVAIDYEDLPKGQQPLPPDAPVLVVLPGLTGGSHDTYVQHLVLGARAAGFRAVVFNSRGTSDSPVTSPQFYSASFTGDTRVVMQHLAAKFPRSPMYGVGYSLGANILVRYLGEEGDKTPLRAAVSLCNPFNLPVSDKNFEKGFNRVYDVNLANSLRNIFKKHQHLFKGIVGLYDPERAANAKTIRDFDDAITRVSFGFPSVDAYYAGSSSSLSIPHVKIPLLCIQAENDPIAPAVAIPYDEIQRNPKCALVVTPTGGHLGWMSGKDGPFGAPWTDEVVLEFMTATMAEQWQQHVAAEGREAADAALTAATQHPKQG